MKEHALVVEDHPAVARQIADILKSMGHTCEIAHTQAAAIELFEGAKFTYCVTDLDIPVEKGGLSRTENGLNLVEQLVEQRHSPDVFIIVATSHARDGGHKLAVRAMQLQAADYVSKDEMVSGDRSLDRVIASQLTKRSKPRSTKKPPNRPARDFVGGELQFAEGGVMLCGRQIVSDKFGESPRVLEFLCQKDRHGQFRHFSGAKIGDALGMTANSVRACIDTLRKNMTRYLADSYVIGKQDVITTGKGGYHLREWIVAEPKQAVKAGR